MASRSNHVKPMASGLSDSNPNTKKPAPPPVKPVLQPSGRTGSRSAYWVPKSGPSNNPAAKTGVTSPVGPSNKYAGTGVFHWGSYPNYVVQQFNQMDNGNGSGPTRNVYKFFPSVVPPLFVPVAINRRGGTGVFIPQLQVDSTSSMMIHGRPMNAKKPSPFDPRMYSRSEEEAEAEIRKMEKPSAEASPNEPLPEIPIELLLPEEWPY